MGGDDQMVHLALRAIGYPMYYVWKVICQLIVMKLWACVIIIIFLMGRCVCLELIWVLLFSCVMWHLMRSYGMYVFDILFDNSGKGWCECVNGSSRQGVVSKVQKFELFAALA